MGGILGGLTKVLFGKPKAPKVDKEELGYIINLMLNANRTNQRGIFGGWDWDDDKTTQTQYVNPEIQPAVDSFVGRVNQGTEDPRNNALMQARFEAMMNRPGLSPRPPARPRPETRGNRSIEDGPPPDWWRR